jgi:hypothetical protein
LLHSITDPAIPASFAFTTALSDFISGVLAIACLAALNNRWRLAVLLAWLFSIIGAVDLTAALSQAEAVPMSAGNWYMPTFLCRYD